jgi:hypothetical protein
VANLLSPKGDQKHIPLYDFSLQRTRITVSSERDVYILGCSNWATTEFTHSLNRHSQSYYLQIPSLQIHPLAKTTPSKYWHHLHRICTAAGTCQHLMPTGPRSSNKGHSTFPQLSPRSQLSFPRLFTAEFLLVTRHLKWPPR